MPANHQIGVEVESEFIPGQSSPGEKRFVFAYTITISNRGSVPARLITRHWLITDGNGEIQEVRGDGVVGVQPHLKPGQSFQYTSGTIIKTPVGSMQGSYQMVADDGKRFDADIAPFSLAVPGLVH
ncbi:MAG: Co2+/Mg2+ efflux protein ApaG [Gammaproteobacteria bacterium]|nr:Co2+/Mg2+ efflux protein ApaG [Gammaproteobacteria bacterium]